MVLGCLILTTFFVSQNIGSKKLDIDFLDIGQGDALLITTPLGRQVLIDTGLISEPIEQRLGDVMDPNDKFIDILVLTHPDSDHVGGALKILKNYKVGIVLYSGLDIGSEIYQLVALEIKRQNISVIKAHVGQRIVLEPHIFLEILSPYDELDSLEPNDYSIVARLVYGKTSALFTGDATKYVEYNIAQAFGSDIQSNILKVGHHGSQTSTNKTFVTVVNPEYGIISAGCDNRFGHPHTEVLMTLMKSNIDVLTTCEEGSISFSSDGNVWIKK